QLALDLFDGFQTDADDDQYRGTAQGEVLPVAADHVDEQVGQHRDDGQVHRAGQRDPAQDEVEVLGRGLTGPDTRDEAAVLPHVVGHLGGIEGDRHVEVREEQDHQEVQRDVHRVALVHQVPVDPDDPLVRAVRTGQRDDQLRQVQHGRGED